MKSMKKVFITGATGFIGSHLVDLLLSQKGPEIFVLVRDPNNLKWLKGLDIHVLTGDVFHVPALPGDIDTVFHLAGSTKAIKTEAYYTVNQKGTASLFETLKNRGLFPRIIHLSSLAAAGPSRGGRALREDVPALPVSPYGKSKRAAEEEALRFKDLFRLVIVRAGAVYGPRDEDFLQYFKSLKSGVLVSLRGRKRLISLCYVKDLVRALDLCARKDLPSGEILNIADSVPHSYEELGREAGRALERDLVTVCVPLGLASVAAACSSLIAQIKKKPHQLNRSKLIDMRQEGWIADTRKAEALLSFKTTYTLARGIEETISWYRENKWL
jgi:dihydroflavonol-4-reductase